MDKTQRLGKEVTLTIKEIKNDSIDGTKELEIKANDFDTTNLILNELEYKSRLYQENKRTRYMLNNIEIDIDKWPMIQLMQNLKEKVKKKF